MNALTLLKSDHGNVEALFKEFETLAPDDMTGRRRVVDQLIEQLSVHAAIEEQLFYPAVRDASEEARADVLESLEEHHVVKWLLSELESLPPTDERFDAKVTVVTDSVRHHVEEEEGELFDVVRAAVPGPELDRLGEAMERAKATAPTRPHPRQPDQPPLNVLLGTPMAVLDRAMAVGKETIGRLLSRG